jgi:hypothetical protein
MSQDSRERWWLPLIIGLIAFLGSALGAVLPRLSFESEETQRKLLEARINAYNDFFKGQAQLQEATQLIDQGRETEAKDAQDKYSVMVKEAKFRVAIYGNKSEVEAIEHYFRKYLHNPRCVGERQRWLDDIKLYQEVRNGVFRGDAKQKIDDAKLIASYRMRIYRSK